MPLPLLPVLGAAAATGARVALTAGARLGMGALRVGGSIAGRLATSFGGALVAGGTALTRAVTPQQTQGGPEESNTEAEATQGAAGVQAEEIQTTPTAVAATGPSTGGDIAGSLRDTPLAILRQIEDNTKQTAQAIGSLSRAERYRRDPMFYGRQDPRDISGAQGSLLLALVPLLASAFQSATEPLRNAIESTRQFVEGVTNTVSGALNSIGEAFSRVASLFPTGAAERANEQAAAGRESLSPRQQAGASPGQVVAGNIAASRNVSNEELANIQETLETPESGETEEQRNTREALNNQLTSIMRTETLAGGGLTIPAEINQYLDERRQRTPATTPPALEPAPPQDRTVDSRLSPISREDRAVIDGVARAMNVNPGIVTGGVFSPSGEVVALIERGGGRREVPAEIRSRNRTERFAVEAQRANSTAEADQYSSPEAINQINRGIETSEEDALRVVDRLQAQRQQQNQTPTVIQVPAAPAAAAPPATRATPSSAAPPPGAGSPASPPPVYPRMINEGSPAGTRS